MPNRKIISLLIVCIAIIISVWVINHYSFKKNAQKLTATNNSGVVADSVEIRDGEDVDSDNDGLNDWQEVLLGTNPTKADTDGDGTADGKEVESGRDPLKAGPNDKSTLTSSLTTDTSTVFPGDTTITNRVSKDFMAQYLILKQHNDTVAPEQVTQIAQNTLSTQEYTKATGVVYTKNDLHVSKTTSKEEVGTYGIKVSSILKTRNPKGAGDELTILDAYVKSNDKRILEKLDPIIQADRGVLTDLLAMTIPSDAVAVHLAFVNAVSNILANTESIRQTYEDPVKGFVGLSQFKPHSLEIINAIKNISLFVEAKTK